MTSKLKPFPRVRRISLFIEQDLLDALSQHAKAVALEGKPEGRGRPAFHNELCAIIHEGMTAWLDNQPKTKGNTHAAKRTAQR